jgi:hypothetical protein
MLSYPKQKTPSSESTAAIPKRQLPALTPHRARHAKRRLVAAYCDGRLSAEAVAQAFKVFPELVGA